MASLRAMAGVPLRTPPPAISTSTTSSTEKSARSRPVAYGEGLADRVGRVDAVLHCAGTVADLVAIAGSPDRVVTIIDLSGDHGVRLTHAAGGPDADPQALHGLAVAADLAERGAFTVPFAEVFPLSRAADAHRLSETGHAHGKIVLV
ncbi:zinc-binding dehydrogenase [Lentzea sp. DG1S-22]|uniref:zinc-binding dehydrogenase n=1 Tax=Lentzea sp. DG1S-22 TaxID=3108822 RepID=UPI002E787977|nr:zinc-binding dehydrogenase [Lentzea sp. DG1S-22]WVH78486.1 zinc-binding dehydrogenase [Lentzea sp. DG1S-22]